MYNSIEPLSLSVISATYDRESVSEHACGWLRVFWGVGVRECSAVGVCGKKKDVFSFFSILERAFFLLYLALATAHSSLCYCS